MRSETKDWIWKTLGWLLLVVFILFNLYMFVRLPVSVKDELIQEMNNLQQYD